VGNAARENRGDPLVTEKTQEVPAADTPLADDPAPATVSANPPARRSAARELIETLVIAAILFFGMRLVMPAVVVDGVSMVPSLQNNQHLLENRLAYFNVEIGGKKYYLFHKPQRGDIVVIEPPIPHDKPFIKRLIGLPGDTVLVQPGKVTVNGVVITENYISQPTAYTWPADGKPYTLGPDEYFVLGDNRNASEDSHFFGPIHAKNIMGKTWVSFWPLSDLKFLPRPPYPV
jgi:signal peptidase I